MTARTLIGLAVVFVLVASVSGQSCVQYKSALAPTLKGVIPEDTWIWTPTGTLAPLEAKVAQLGLALGSLTPGCRDATARMVAAQAFMKCNEEMRLLGINIPRLPCRSSCNAVVAACPFASPDWVLLTLLFQKPVDQVCTGMGLGGALPPTTKDFPDVCTNFTLPGPTIFCSACNQIDTPINVQYGSCMNYNGTVCKGVISGPVYSPAGLCQQNIEDRLSNLPNVFASLTSMTCRSATAKALCNSAFPKCDNTSATSLLQFAATSYLQPQVAPFLPPGFQLKVPTVVLPRFPTRQFCWNMHNECLRSAGPTAPEWVPGLNVASQLGLYLNAAMDGNKLRVLLGPSWPRPTCDQDINPPIGQLDWPDGPTIFGQATVNGTAYNVSSPPNPFYDASNTIQPNIPVCANFDSADLAANTPPALGETASLSYCKNIIPEGFSVFVPSGKTMYDLNKLARSAHFLFGLMPVKEGCNLAFAKFACWQIFNPCKNDTFTTTLPTMPGILANRNNTAVLLSQLKVVTPFPRFPCKNVCEDYETRCAEFFVDNPSAKPNCTQAKNAPSGALPGQSKTYECDFVTLKTPGQPDFPARGATAAGTTYFTRLVFPLAPLNQTIVTNVLYGAMNETFPAHVLDATLQTTCNGDPQDSALATNPTLADLPVICPWPTLHPSTMKYGKTVSPDFVGLGGGYCGQPCPGFLYTEDTYESNFQMFSALSVISFVLLAWMLLTWTCFKEKREKINVYCFLICTFGVSIVGMISVIWGAREVTCASSVEEAKMGRHDSTLCVVQGAILVYFGLAACLWWAIQATNIFIDVNWKKRITNTIAFRLRVVYTLIGFGFPVITVVSMLATNNIGHANAIAFCAGIGLVWPLFYGPIALCILIGTLGMLFIIGTIWKSTKKTAKTTAGSQIRVLIRPLLFVLTFLLCFTMVFLYRVYGDIGGDTIKNSITEWVKCYLVESPTARYRNDTMPLGCPARPSEAPNATYYNLIHIAIGAQGLFVFLIYGTETEQFGLWAQLCGCKPKKTADTSDERTRGTTRTTSGGSQGGSRGGGKQTLRVPRGDGEGGSREGSRNNSKHDPEENKLVASTGPSDADQVRVEMQPTSGMAPAPASDSNASAISYPPPPVPGGDGQAMVPPPLDG